jgi:hypothetical protein
MIFSPVIEAARLLSFSESATAASLAIPDDAETSYPEKQEKTSNCYTDLATEG